MQTQEPLFGRYTTKNAFKGEAPERENPFPLPTCCVCGTHTTDHWWAGCSGDRHGEHQWDLICEKCPEPKGTFYSAPIGKDLPELYKKVLHIASKAWVNKEELLFLFAQIVTHEQHQELLRKDRERKANLS